jgi:hypothetical protein
MKPERVFRIGPVSASVFVNETESEGGKRRFRSVNLQRRYRDSSDGEWKSSSSFGLAELPQAMAVLDLALKHLASEEGDLSGAAPF